MTNMAAADPIAPAADLTAAETPGSISHAHDAKAGGNEWLPPNNIVSGAVL